MKTVTSKIKDKSKKISGMIGELRKQFFELEVLQSEWEAKSGLMKPIKSGKDYISSLIKRA